MATQALALAPEAYNAQAVAMTARAFSKPAVARALGARSERVVAFMAQVGQEQPAGQWSPQAVGMLLLSVAELPVPDSLPAARYLIQVLLDMTHYQLGAGAMRAVAMACTAVEELDVYDALLLRHLSHCVQRAPLSVMRPTWVRALASCYVHFNEAEHNRPLMDYLSQVCISIYLSLSLDIYIYTHTRTHTHTRA